MVRRGLTKEVKMSLYWVCLSAEKATHLLITIFLNGAWCDSYHTTDNGSDRALLYILETVNTIYVYNIECLAKYN